MEKGELTQALAEAAVQLGEQVAWADEMPVGLHGQVRRVWAPRGVKLVQQVELSYVWHYLALAVDGLSGQLWWQWLPNMKQESIAGVVKNWQEEGIAALVWDGAPSHRARSVQKMGMPLVGLPPASPELNPAERVFEELRRAIEGRVYGAIDRKMAAVERELVKLAGDPQQVRSVAGWGWLQEALSALPPPFTAFS